MCQRTVLLNSTMDSLFDHVCSCRGINVLDILIIPISSLHGCWKVLSEPGVLLNLLNGDALLRARIKDLSHEIFAQRADGCVCR